MNEHPLDRLGRAIRPAVICLAWLAFPIFLYTYGWGLVLILDEVGFAWWLPIIGAQVIGWGGIAALFDMRTEQSQSKGSDQ